MAQYFNNADMDLIQSEKITELLHRADKHPEKYIRIALNREGMRLDYKNQGEFEIRQAVFFVWTFDENLYRFEFCPNDPELHLYAAIDQKNFFAFSVEAPKYPMEGLCEFKNEESVMGIFRTEASTIFITYDGTEETIGYGSYPEKEGCPSVYHKLLSLFDISKPLAVTKD